MRLDYTKVAPDGIRAVYGLQNYMNRHAEVDHKLQHLIELRCSQINGCAFCMHMHSLQLRSAGETDARIDSLAGWEETELYTEKERAALAWAEAVTKVGETHVPDRVYEELQSQFSEREIVDLTLAVGMINLWNRLGVSFRSDPLMAPAVIAMSKT